MSLSAGTRLGPYEIVAPLGAGGMGEVYRARDPRMGREVAIKISGRAIQRPVVHQKSIGAGGPVGDPRCRRPRRRWAGRPASRNVRLDPPPIVHHPEAIRLAVSSPTRWLALGPFRVDHAQHGNGESPCAPQ
jgi:hypothetical protein